MDASTHLPENLSSMLGHPPESATNADGASCHDMTGSVPTATISKVDYVGSTGCYCPKVPEESDQIVSVLVVAVLRVRKARKWNMQ